MLKYKLNHKNNLKCFHNITCFQITFCNRMGLRTVIDFLENYSSEWIQSREFQCKRSHGRFGSKIEFYDP